MAKMVDKMDKSSRPVSPVNGQPLPRGMPFLTSEEAREAGRKGGKKSAAVKAARKTLREELLELLRVEIEGKDGRKKSTQEAMSASLIKQALVGNTRAFEIIRDTIGEKPVDNVSIVSADFSALEDAFKGISDDGGR